MDFYAVDTGKPCQLFEGSWQGMLAGWNTAVTDYEITDFQNLLLNFFPYFKLLDCIFINYNSTFACLRFGFHKFVFGHGFVIQCFCDA